LLVKEKHRRRRAENRGAKREQDRGTKAVKVKVYLKGENQLHQTLAAATPPKEIKRGAKNSVFL